MMEKLKSIPIPIWIGLALVLIVIFIVNSKASGSSAPPQTTPGPVTANTVGSPGAQSNAGTDQQLGNLSQMTQGGFAELLQNQQQMEQQITTLQSGQQTGLQQTANVPPPVNRPPNNWWWTGNGGMIEFGGNVQNAQNSSAQGSAYTYSNGMPVNNWQG